VDLRCIPDQKDREAGGWFSAEQKPGFEKRLHKSQLVITLISSVFYLIFNG
jgi:hypothetical protein